MIIGRWDFLVGWLVVVFALLFFFPICFVAVVVFQLK